MIARFICQSLLKGARARIARPALGDRLPRPEARQRFEAVVDTFLSGFQTVLEGGNTRQVPMGLDREFCGFWFEGAAMGVALLDWLMPWRQRRWDLFVRECGAAHVYMLHVGAGWAMARMPGNIETAITRFDPLLRWLLVDGYGFHEGFFHPARCLRGQPHPARIRGYAQRAFDQGLGRSMWFASGANVQAIATAIENFSTERRGDLWSGVGLASTYAGQVDDADLTRLREFAGSHFPQLAQGAAFAAKARERAGNLTDYQERACATLCAVSARDAAAITDDALRELPRDGAVPAFEIWRQRIQDTFAENSIDRLMKTTFARSYAVAIAAGLLIVPAYFASREPVLPAEDGAQLASRFKFTLTPLPEVPGQQHKMVRAVHPSLQRIAQWISSLGAAATLGDLDGDGLPNDVCFVDPRTDLVTVAPVPGTPARYEPFILDAAPLAYDAASTAPMGTVFGDFNEDGLLDVLVYYWGRSPVLFMQKSGALARGSFIAQELADGGESWNTNAATQADFDGDGHTDLLIANYFPDGARNLDAHAVGAVSMHEGKAKAANGGRKHFFLWKSAAKGAAPSVHYEHATSVLPDEVDRGWTLAAAAVDLDGDLLPEIYLANDFGRDRLLHNRSTRGHLQFAILDGVRDFRTPKSCVLGHDTFKGMGAEFGDVDGDGKFDIYVSNIGTKFGLTESHFLWLNTGNAAGMKDGIAPFVHDAEKLGLARSGWGWDSKLADFDNDGVNEAIQAVGFMKGTINRWPELQALGTSNDQIVHNPRFWPNFKPGADLSGDDTNPFFVMGKDGRYHDVASLLGLDTPMVSRAIAIGDVDGDGRLDYALGNQWGQSVFVHNESPAAGKFLGLHVLLSDEIPATEAAVAKPGHPTRAPNAHAAIGAIVSVKMADGREHVSFVDGGSGHSGRRSPEVHFGLGAIDPNAELPIKIRWRDGTGNPQESTSLRLKSGWHTVLLPNKVTRIATK